MRRVWHRADGYVVELEVSHSDESFVARLGVYRVEKLGRRVERVITSPTWAPIDVRPAKQYRKERMLKMVRDLEEKITDGEYDQQIERLA